MDVYDIADELQAAWVDAGDRDRTGDRYAISAAFRSLTRGERLIHEGSFLDNIMTLAESGKTLSKCRQSAA